MFYYFFYSLGGNVILFYIDFQVYEEYIFDGVMVYCCYYYFKGEDQIIKYLIFLLENVGVQLVFYGYFYFWNCFVSFGGMYFLEIFNVGNSYGVYLVDNFCFLLDFIDFNNDFFVGNFNGLLFIIFIIVFLFNFDGKLLFYIVSNKIIVFSVLEIDEDNVVIKSYYFDSSVDNNNIVLFD